jgi:hypothetical protein
VPASHGVNLLKRGEIPPGETRCETDHGRPEAPVDVGNLAVDQSTGHHIRRGTNRARQPEDLMAFGVAPPAPCDWPADYGLREVWHGSSSAFKHDTMAANEGNRGSRGHLVIDTSKEVLLVQPNDRASAAAPPMRFNLSRGRPAALAAASACYAGQTRGRRAATPDLGETRVVPSPGLAEAHRLGRQPRVRGLIEVIIVAAPRGPAGTRSPVAPPYGARVSSRAARRCQLVDERTSTCAV